MNKSLLKNLVFLPIISLVSAAHAHVIKSDASMKAIAKQQVYENSHNQGVYNLYMLDMAYNISDQYMDQVVSAAIGFSKKEIASFVLDAKLTPGQLDSFNQAIKAAEQNNGLDLRHRINILVQLDNLKMQNHFSSLGLAIPAKPKDFKDFDIDDYYNLKFDAYLSAVDQIMSQQLQSYQLKDLLQSAKVTPQESLIALVNDAPFKQKLRTLIVQEIQERHLSDLDKAKIAYWCELIKGYVANAEGM